MNKSIIKLYSAVDKRQALISACKTAPVDVQKLRFRQVILPQGFLIEFGSGPEKLGWYSIRSLSIALGLVQPEGKMETSNFDAKRSLKALVAARERKVGMVLLK